MKKITCLILTGMLSAGLTVSAQDRNPQDKTPQPKQQEEKRAEKARGEKSEVSKADADFLQRAAEINLAEIAMGKVARERAAAANTKELAKHIVDDHQKSQKRVEALAKARGVELPREAPRREQSLVDRLNKREGEEFDQDFVRENVEAHRKAITLYERSLDKVQDPEVKNYIKESLPGLKEHLRMAEKAQGGRGRKPDEKPEQKKKE